MNITKKIFSLLLVAVMVFTVAPVTINATAIDATGQCGANVFWTFDEATGELTISGSGKMYDYEFEESPFKLNTDIKKVVVEEGITRIGVATFANCTKLESIEFPTTLKSLGENALVFCTSIESIVLPYGVESLGNGVFYSCANLESITIPESLTYIPDKTFALCTSLESIELPDSITNIGVRAFESCSKLSNITLSENINRIEEEAFYYCESLKSIEIPAGITTIFHDIFIYCNNLINVHFCGTQEQWNAVYVSDNRILEDLVHTAVDEDNNGICDMCVEIPDEEITEPPVEEPSTGDQDPTDPAEVETGKYGSNVYWTFNRETGEVIFDGTGYMWDNMPKNSPFYNDQDVKTVIIKDGIKNVGMGVFFGCINLESVTLADSVNIISTEAFAGCEKLKEIPVTEKIIEIGNRAFASCASIESVIIPANITTLGSYVFTNCDGIINVEIYSKKTSEGMFSDCSSLKNVTITDSVVEIGRGAFSACPSLENIVLPDSITEIPMGAFNGSGLKSITFGDIVDFIDEYAFCDCPNLTNVYFGGTMAQWEEIEIEYHNDDLSNATIHCIDGIYDENEEFPSEDDPDEEIPPTTTSPSTTAPTTAEKTEQPTKAPSATNPPAPSAVPVTTTAPSTTAKKEQPTVKAQKPSKVKIKKPKSAKKKQITITWNAVKDANGYQIAYSPNKKFRKISTKTRIIKKGSTTKTTLKKLTSGKKYFIKIRAYKNANGKKLYGTYSKVMSVKVK